MEKDEEKHYEKLKDYLGLESEQDAMLFEYLEGEFSEMGPWGEKIITYLRAILSRNKRYKSYIQESDVELFKKILEDSMTVLDLRLKNYKENDEDIQGNNTLTGGGTPGE